MCDNGYEVLSYKKRYHYYYVVNRALETAEVVMLADVINASKLPVAQKKALAQRLAETLCSHQAENISKHIVSLDKGRKGNSSFIYNVDAIDRAINDNKQISFLYFIATPQIAVTLDNCSKEWYSMSPGDEKNGQNAAQ